MSNRWEYMVLDSRVTNYFHPELDGDALTRRLNELGEQEKPPPLSDRAFQGPPINGEAQPAKRRQVHHAQNVWQAGSTG